MFFQYYRANISDLTAQMNEQRMMNSKQISDLTAQMNEQRRISSKQISDLTAAVNAARQQAAQPANVVCRKSKYHQTSDLISFCVIKCRHKFPANKESPFLNILHI